MTGALVPEGANCVIMQEYVETGSDDKIVFTASETDKNFDPRGQDLKKGDILLPMGTILNPGHLGIISSTGKLHIEVARQLLIGILATGSELIEAIAVSSLPLATLRDVFGATAELPEGVATEVARTIPRGNAEPNRGTRRIPAGTVLGSVAADPAVGPADPLS